MHIGKHAAQAGPCACAQSAWAALRSEIRTLRGRPEPPAPAGPCGQRVALAGAPGAAPGRAGAAGPSGTRVSDDTELARLAAQPALAGLRLAGTPLARRPVRAALVALVFTTKKETC